MTWSKMKDTRSDSGAVYRTEEEAQRVKVRMDRLRESEHAIVPVATDEGPAYALIDEAKANIERQGSVATLKDKAMLAVLSIGQYTNNVTDEKGTEAALRDANARWDAGKFKKAPIDPRNESLKAIRAIAAEARAYHRATTVPWLDRGIRMLSNTMYLEYRTKMNELKVRFNQAVSTFLENYRKIIEAEKKRLGSMFSEHDYPQADDMKGQFGFYLNYYPCADSGDFRVQAGEEELEKLRKETAEQQKLELAKSVLDVWKRVFIEVHRMAGKLAEEDAIFRNSLIENVRYVTKLIPHLNITDDPQLTTIQKEIEEKLLAHSPDKLRKDKETRKKVASEATAIADQMAGMFAPVKKEEDETGTSEEGKTVSGTGSVSGS